MAWYKVADIADLSSPFLRKVNAGGKAICLINTNGKLFATSNTCPHAGADLSTGWCENENLICPFHRYQYDLNTGRGASGQNDFVKTYKVEVRVDGIFVEANSWLEKIKRAFKD